MQTDAGRGSGKTKLQKNDIYSKKVLLKAPPPKTKPAKPAKLMIDKCWFHGLEKEKDIRASRITDHDDDPQSGIRAHFKKIMKKPLGLAGWPNKRGIGATSRAANEAAPVASPHMGSQRRSA